MKMGSDHPRSSPLLPSQVRWWWWYLVLFYLLIITKCDYIINQRNYNQLSVHQDNTERFTCLENSEVLKILR